MEFFSYASDIIILIAAVLGAIGVISSWIGKPIKFFKQQSDEAFKTKVLHVVQHEDLDFESRVLHIVNQKLPGLLVKHDLEVRDKYKADRERYLQEIKAEVLKDIQNQIAEATRLSTEVSKLGELYHSLAVSAKDVLREKIMQLYFAGKDSGKVLTEHQKEVLEQYYVDYKAMKGNSYIDKYYNRMKKWKVVEDDYDEEEQ